MRTDDGGLELEGAVIWAVAFVSIWPLGLALALLARFPHPQWVRVGLLSPFLLAAFGNAALLVLPWGAELPLAFSYAAFAVLSMASYAIVGWWSGDVSRKTRLIVAGAMALLVLLTVIVTKQREKAADAQIFATSGFPLVMPATVPGRTLVRASVLPEIFLELAYAEEPDEEPDVFVRVLRGGESPPMICSGNEPPCERLAADTWLASFSHGRKTLSAKRGDSWIEVDSSALTKEELMVCVRELRKVSADYLARFPRHG
ncbi:hypothetical protein [Nonomuraea sp. SYSU D8015]|uniref:hypothetical protein n=1 Tax=Nonomuraea sp. SYSU D8015 TaxID=2593644 RepID=UPI00166098C7|nr:hypothetical protein [Nonomuraea sp. SYSU D8015]